MGWRPSWCRSHSVWNVLASTLILWAMSLPMPYNVCSCAGFRTPARRALHALMGPASEKRQGTKSRWVRDAGASVLGTARARPADLSAEELFVTANVATAEGCAA